MFYIMDVEVKKAIIKKLSRTQVFILCVLSLLCFVGIVWMLCLLSPTSLPTFFEIL